MNYRNFLRTIMMRKKNERPKGEWNMLYNGYFFKKIKNYFISTRYINAPIEEVPRYNAYEGR